MEVCDGGSMVSRSRAWDETVRTRTCVRPSGSDPTVFAADDSGGPALDAEGRIIGVVSRGLSGCRSPIYASVFEFAEWLRTEAMLAAKAGAYEAPSWARAEFKPECDAAREECEESSAELASTCAYSGQNRPIALLYWLMLFLGVCWRRVRRLGLSATRGRA